MTLLAVAESCEQLSQLNWPGAIFLSVVVVAVVWFVYQLIK